MTTTNKKKNNDQRETEIALACLHSSCATPTQQHQLFDKITPLVELYSTIQESIVGMLLLYREASVCGINKYRNCSNDGLSEIENALPDQYDVQPNIII